jgi:D-arabinose 1-dehydrogenase-like Zn-dependent alcohol dehydrogenase
MHYSDISRRNFVAASVTAASAARVSGANDRIRLGVIGTGGRGSHLIRMARAAGGDKVEFVAVCDAWDQRRDEAEKLIGHPVAKLADYRALLDRKTLTVSSSPRWIISTPA